MTSAKSKRKTAPRSVKVKPVKSRSLKRPNPARVASSARDKMRTGTKNVQVITMLQTGATIAAIMAATGWQQHSVRGFFAGVVRKRLGLNLVSEPGDDGRIYRIISDTATSAKTGQVKQAA